MASNPFEHLVPQQNRAAPAPSGPRLVPIGAPDPTRVAAEQRAAAAEGRANRAENRADNPVPAGYRRKADGSLEPIPGGPADPTRPTARTRVLPQTAITRLEEGTGTLMALDRAVHDFRDDYAGNTITGRMENWLQSSLGTGTPGQAQYWSDVYATDNLARHALFGASLTQGEKDAWERTTVNPSMNPAQIRANLTRRAEIARSALRRAARTYRANGYNPDAIRESLGEMVSLLDDDAQQAAPVEADASNVGGGGSARDVVPQAGAMITSGQVQPGPQGQPFPERMDQSAPLPEIDGPDGRNQLGGGAPVATPLDIAAAETQAARGTAIARQNKPATEIIAELNAYLASIGRPGLSGQQVDEIRRIRRSGGRHPGFSPTVIPTDIPTPQEQLGELISPSDSGSTAFAASALDSASLGAPGLLPGEMGANYRNRMADVRATNPGASMAGSIAGSFALPGAMSTNPARQVLLNAGYGAAHAFNASGGDPVQALVGAGIGGSGYAVGNRAVGGAGRVLTGARDSTTRYLAERGIQMSLGRMMGGQNPGRFASVVRGIEDRLGVGRTGESQDAFLDQYNRETFSEATESIGRSPAAQGEVGVEQMLGRAARDGEPRVGGIVGEAYDDAFRGVRVAADPAFEREAADALAAGARLPPDLRRNFDWIVDNRVSQAMDNGTLSGRDFQALRQSIRDAKLATRGELGASDYRDALGQLEQSLRRLVDRGSPETGAALRAADQAYGKARTVEAAVTAARNTEGRVTPQQVGTAATQNARRFGGDQGRTTRPFFESQRAAARADAMLKPRAGQGDRQWVAAAFPALPAILGGAAYQTGLVTDPTTLALFATLGLPYTRRGAKLLQRMMTSRPEAVREAGEAVLRQQQNVGGRIGRGATSPIIDETSSPEWELPERE